jgi:hypothetical protein
MPDETTGRVAPRTGVAKSKPQRFTDYLRMMDDAVRIVTAVQKPTAVVAETTSWEHVPRVWRALLAEVWAFLRGSDLTTGRNVTLYKDDSPNVEVGVEVSSSFMGSGRVVPSSLPAGRAAVAVARGEPSPAKLAKATSGEAF